MQNAEIEAFIRQLFEHGQTLRDEWWESYKQYCADTQNRLYANLAHVEDIKRLIERMSPVTRVAPFAVETDEVFEQDPNMPPPLPSRAAQMQDEAEHYQRKARRESIDRGWAEIRGDAM